MLELRNISAGYPSGASPRPVLSGVSLTLEEGEILGVIGGSGSGKTTLLRLVAGQIAPQSGVIAFPQGIQSDVWLMLQTPTLIDFRTSLQNALLAREVVAPLVPSDVAEGRAMLTSLALGDSLDRLPAHLSGGMRRRVSVGQALLSRRRLILLDEPFAELDSLARRQTENVIHEVDHPHRSLLIVSHDLDSICALCDRVMILTGPPLQRTVMQDISGDLRTHRGPEARRASTNFTDAVAALQKAVLEAA